VRHRNHLGVMTASPELLNESAILVDFTDPGYPAYGTNARKAVGDAMALWAGDVSADHVLRYVGEGNDRDPILVAIGGTVPTATVNGQYRQQDVNLDGAVKYVGEGNDRDPILQNVGGSVPTNTRSEQLP
jgi:hypothetical protein